MEGLVSGLFRERCGCLLEDFQEHHVPVSTMNYWMHKLKFSKRKIIRRIASPYIQLHNKKQEML